LLKLKVGLDVRVTATESARTEAPGAKISTATQTVDFREARATRFRVDPMMDMGPAPAQVE
jgi:hypothetical protein